MESNNELTAAMLLNAFNTARLYYAVTGKPEPEPEGTLLQETIEAWKYLVFDLESKTTSEVVLPVFHPS